MAASRAGSSSGRDSFDVMLPWFGMHRAMDLGGDFSDYGDEDAEEYGMPPDAIDADARSAPSRDDDSHDVTWLSSPASSAARYDRLAARFANVGASSVSDMNSISRSASATPPSVREMRIRNLVGLDDGGFGDDFSDAAHFFGEDTDDSVGETQSEGFFASMGSGDEDDELFGQVSHPPQLPVVSDERLLGAWPLGEMTFSIFVCPITHSVMTDPVVSADGHTYERAAIARWFQTSRKSPVTGQLLPHTDLVPNHSVRTLLKTLIDMTEAASAASPPAASKSPLVAAREAAGSPSASSSGASHGADLAGRSRQPPPGGGPPFGSPPPRLPSRSPARPALRALEDDAWRSYVRQPPPSAAGGIAARGASVSSVASAGAADAAAPARDTLRGWLPGPAPWRRGPGDDAPPEELGPSPAAPPRHRPAASSEDRPPQAEPRRPDPCAAPRGDDEAVAAERGAQAVERQRGATKIPSFVAPGFHRV